MVDVVVVGSGPNGLTAAVELARAGVEVAVLEAHDQIGGGTRSAELTVPGLVHDVCAAVHPFGIASPVFRRLGLERHGLQWAHAPIELAHPLDDGPPGFMMRDVDATATNLGVDGDRWRSLFAPLAERFDDLAAEVLAPVWHLPRRRGVGPALRLAARGVMPAATLARRWETEQARGLFAGMAAHVMGPLTAPGTAGLGMFFAAAGHASGWPVAVGGSGAIAAALAAELEAHGGTIHTGVTVRAWGDLPPGRATVFDLTPGAVVDIAADQLSSGVVRSLGRWRHGPAAYKVDLAVEGAVPWRDPICATASTVHLGGTLDEIVANEAAVSAGRMPERPFVLVAQQHLADPDRSVDNVHPLWTYAHVPHDFRGDATEAVLGQLDRFAPGVRDHIVDMHVMGPVELERYNASYVGGDIAGGSNSGRQLVIRPRLTRDPYRLGANLFMCSASTPPGAGVHGMCGAHAARSVLRFLGSG